MVRDPSRADPLRATLAALACSGTTVALGRAAIGLIAGALQAGAAPDRPIAALVVGIGTVAAGGLAVGCWLLAASGLVHRLGALAAWCDRAGARLTPALLRRAVGLTAGVGLGVAALGGVASASEPDLGWEVTTTISTPAAPDADPADVWSTTGYVEPEPAANREVIVPTPAARPPNDALDPPAVHEAPAAVLTVTVRPGDCLWRIAAEHLGDATNAEIAAEWPQWYELNRAVIGADPDLIHPGQVLRVPADAPNEPTS